MCVIWTNVGCASYSTSESFGINQYDLDYTEYARYNHSKTNYVRVSQDMGD